MIHAAGGFGFRYRIIIFIFFSRALLPEEIVCRYPVAATYISVKFLLASLILFFSSRV